MQKKRFYILSCLISALLGAVLTNAYFSLRPNKGVSDPQMVEVPSIGEGKFSINQKFLECKTDADKFGCKFYPQEKGGNFGCMIKFAEKFNSECQRSFGKYVYNKIVECTENINNFCTGQIESGVVACLFKNQSKLSQVCRNALRI